MRSQHGNIIVHGTAENCDIAVPERSVRCGKLTYSGAYVVALAVDIGSSHKSDISAVTVISL